MHKHWSEFNFGDFFEGAFGARGAGFWPPRGPQGRAHRRRQAMFESGDLKLVILRLLREQPRHGYDIIKALEERLAGCYTPSAGSVYPTLQLLEDQGLVRAKESDGRRVYSITPEGERYLDERRSDLDQILERVRETVRDFAGGAMGDLNRAFGELARLTYREAFRRGASDPAVPRVVEILRRAAEEVSAEWSRGRNPGEDQTP